MTSDMAMIQPLFASSKWNMGELFGLKIMVKSGLTLIPFLASKEKLNHSHIIC